MSLLAFVVVASAAAVASLVTRGQTRLAIPVGLGGLLLATVAALLIAPGETIRLGSSDVLEATAYARLFVVLASATGLILCLVGLATTLPQSLPAALLAGLAGTGLALSLSDPLAALLVLLATAVAVSLVALMPPVTNHDVRVVATSLRVLVLAGALAIVALAWTNPSFASIGGDPQAFGLADLAIVLAVAVRFGAIPFHRPVGGLTATAPGTSLPLLLVWGPAALAVVVIGATDGSANPLFVPSGIGPALIVALALASLALGAVGAWLQDDLERVVGYSIVQDAGFVLLGLAIAGPAAHAPARTWLLILVAAKGAFAAWATVVEARFRSGRLPELGGWARRSPLLAAALVGIAVATIGVPGLLAWQVRSSLVEGATGGPLAIVLVLAGLASIAYYARILVIGTDRPSMLVAAAPSDRPVRSDRGPTIVESVANGWSANRAPIAAGLVLVLVLVSVVVAGGGFGGPEAAGGAGPQGSPAARIGS